MSLPRSLAIALLALCAPAAFAHESATGNQKRAVEEYLRAVSTGDPQSVAYAIHPEELEGLRTRIVTTLKEEAARGENTIRGRLFGSAMPLSEIERLTMISFYSTLGRKLHLTGREYDDYRYIGAIPDSGDTAHVIVRGRVPRERGESGRVEVVHVVTLKRYGKDWKATLPSEIEAQIYELSHGRRLPGLARRGYEPGAAADPAAATGTPSPPAADSATPVAVRERLAAAEKALADSKCEEYYKEHMSPRFRRVISKKALEALIASCQNNIGNREMLLSALKIVRGLEPRFEYNSQRAVYDVSGQGLPFDRFALELIDRKWYIAE